MYYFLILAGLLIGILSTFFGIGGGVIAVPTMYTLFPNLAPQTVIGTSLGMIFFNSLVNIYNFVKLGRTPKMRPSIILGLSMFLGVIIGSNITSSLSPRTIKTFLGVVLALVALRTMLSEARGFKKVKDWEFEINIINIIKISAIGLFSGMIVGMTGLGGGVTLVPLFIMVFKMPFNWLPVYSNIAMGCGSLTGLITYIILGQNSVSQSTIFPAFQFGYVNFALSGLLVFGVFFSSRLGIKIGDKIPPHITKTLFALLLAIMSFKIFYSLS